MEDLLILIGIILGFFVIIFIIVFFMDNVPKWRNNKRNDRIFKEFPELEKLMQIYFDEEDKYFKWFNKNISPLKREERELRKKLVEATNKEREELSERIEDLKKKALEIDGIELLRIADFRKPVLEELDKLNPDDREFIRNYWNLR